MKISVYTKTGAQAATTYYRVYQYLKDINADFHYHKMLPDKLYQYVMPIYTKPLIIKTLIFLYIYIRVFFQLLSDLIWKPDIIILSRRFINRYLPLPYIQILKYLVEGETKIIYDFDDNVIEMKEVRKKDFKFICDISSTIIVASPINIELVPINNRKKIIQLPTTDGDMYSRLSPDILDWRLENIKSELVLVWTGTSVSLEFVRAICQHIEIAASKIDNLKITLKVICNLPLEYQPLNFKLFNIKWDRETAINELLHSHVGLMPLDNSVKSQGKGGFKLIQYLSIGLPVIGSDTGINSSIIDPQIGYSISSLNSDEWITAICQYATNPKMWLNMSRHCTEKWHKEYSFDSNHKIWKKLLS